MAEEGSFFRKRKEDKRDEISPHGSLEIEAVLSDSNEGRTRAFYDPSNGLLKVIRETGFSSYVLIEEKIPDLSEFISTSEDLFNFTSFLRVLHEDLFYTEKATRLAISKENKDKVYILGVMKIYFKKRKDL